MTNRLIDWARRTLHTLYIRRLFRQAERDMMELNKKLNRHLSAKLPREKVWPCGF